MHEGHRQRLREAFLAHGVSGMADHNILELLLTYAIPRRDVNPIAHRLIDAFGSLDGVLKAAPQELQRIEGVGMETAAFLSLVSGMTKRILMDTFSDARGRIRLGVPETACRYAIASLMSERYETLRAVYLDVNLYVLSDVKIADGTLSRVPMEPRNIIEHALLKKAAGVMLMHNHPSGSPLPSSADAVSAAAVSAAAEPLGISVLDQLIVGGNAVYSFRYDKVFVCPNERTCLTQTVDEYRQTLTASGGAAKA